MSDLASDYRKQNAITWKDKILDILKAEFLNQSQTGITRLHENLEEESPEVREFYEGLGLRCYEAMQQNAASSDQADESSNRSSIPDEAELNKICNSYLNDPKNSCFTWNQWLKKVLTILKDRKLNGEKKDQVIKASVQEALSASHEAIRKLMDEGDPSKKYHLMFKEGDKKNLKILSFKDDEKQALAPMDFLISLPLQINNLLLKGDAFNKWYEESWPSEIRDIIKNNSIQLDSPEMIRAFQKIAAVYNMFINNQVKQANLFHMTAVDGRLIRKDAAGNIKYLKKAGEMLYLIDEGLIDYGKSVRDRQTDILEAVHNYYFIKPIRNDSDHAHMVEDGSLGEIEEGMSEFEALRQRLLSDVRLLEDLRKAAQKQ